MSLKAKLEAVVYAAEEPVTLATLAAMFAEEVSQDLAQEQNAPPEPASEQIELLTMEPSSEVPAEEASQEPQPETAAADVAAPEAAEKKLARQRDRQIRQVLQAVLDELIRDYASADRGMEIREIAGGYRMATKPEYHDAVRGFVKSLKPPMKLSLQALETLAVIAYKQPVTAPEVSEIRGVDSGGVLGSLVSRKLITTAGRKQVIGRPILYKTTKEFLLRFGLKDVNDLPSMEEFEKMAGELAETEGETAEPLLQGTEENHTAENSATENGETEPVTPLSTEEGTGEEPPAHSPESAEHTESEADIASAEEPPTHSPESAEHTEPEATAEPAEESNEVPAEPATESEP